MFAVPGWSLGPEPPKRDVGPKSSAKKRKKKSGDEHAADSTAQATVFSKKNTDQSAKSSSQTQSRKSNKRKESDFRKPQMNPETAPEAQEHRPSKRQKHLGDSASVKGEEHRPRGVAEGSKEEVDGKGLSGPSKLTPLQSAMQKKLLGARFRHLNESLYTTASAEAHKMFDSNPAFFNEYHLGFRSQVATWPENPVDTFVAELKERAPIRPPKFNKQSRPVPFSDRSDKTVRAEPLPRTHGKCTVADLGCGDASIAKQVKKLGKKMGVEVLSFDLQSPNPLVTKADISALPLESDSVNVAIFCLALMGTNWIDFIEEAWRILHWKGELWIAEIKSRFGSSGRKAKTENLRGNKKAKKPAEQRKRKQEEEEKAAQGLIEEAAGSEAMPQKTDVSAFVAILKKRGFVLENEQGLDLGNKMFVRMRLVKASKPVKGKYKEDLPDDASFMAKNKAWRDLLREEEEVDEASVLKPCLYKIR